MLDQETFDGLLREIQRRCDAATPGPWTAFVEGRDHESGSSFVRTSAADIELTGASEADHDFIANARQDVPKLLAEIRVLRELLRQDDAGVGPRVKMTLQDEILMIASAIDVDIPSNGVALMISCRCCTG